MMAKQKAEDDARQAGTAHLVNLNEDPMLDRKVFYDISVEEVTVGRRGKGVAHKIQLSGTGIKPNHCKLHLDENGDAIIQCLDEKATDQVKINGKDLKTMDPVKLKPNDRICIGPSAIYLFKNNAKLDDSCHQDAADDPITFDFASDEVYVAENAEADAEKAAAAAEMEAAHKKAMEEMEAKFKAEAESNAALLADKETAAAALAEEAAAAGGDADKQAELAAKEKELRSQIEAESAANAKASQSKSRELMAAGLKQKML